MTDASAELDCRTCGACCREASDGRILVTSSDLARWHRRGRRDLEAGLVDGHFGERGLPATPDGACLHLAADGDCSIYPQRPDTCRDFEAGSAQCLEFRRARGL